MHTYSVKVEQSITATLTYTFDVDAESQREAEETAIGIVDDGRAPDEPTIDVDEVLSSDAEATLIE